VPQPAAGVRAHLVLHHLPAAQVDARVGERAHHGQLPVAGNSRPRALGDRAERADEQGVTGDDRVGQPVAGDDRGAPAP
jgi:hypothetical protein